MNHQNLFGTTKICVVSLSFPVFSFKSIPLCSLRIWKKIEWIVDNRPHININYIWEWNTNTIATTYSLFMKERIQFFFSCIGRFGDLASIIWRDRKWQEKSNILKNYYCRKGVDFSFPQNTHWHKMKCIRHAYNNQS